MLTFIIGVAIVFVAVDLFVRLVVEPWLSGKNKKLTKSSTSKLDPKFKLATETMYDGGKPHTSEGTNSIVDDDDNSKD